MISSIIALYEGFNLIKRLIFIGSIVAAIAAAYGYWHYSVYSSGYASGRADERAEIAQKNKEAIDAADKASDRRRACLDAGRMWDVTTGQCH